ncbi:MAG: universal stress protein [Halobacteriales archaeon]
MYDDVLIATDGSETADSAAEHAIAQAKRFGATLHVVHAVAPGLTDVISSDSVGELVRDAETNGEEIVENVAEKARAEGVEVRTHVEQRSPHEAVLEYAEENGVDLIVVGSRGKSEKRLRDRLLGGVSTKVVYLSDVPVLTVR